MSDTVFRSKVETTDKAEELPKASPLTTGDDVQVEVPYLDYMNQHGKPFIVDSYNLGDTWDDPEGGFPEEVQTIEDYIQGKIQSGEIANSIEAVKELIKGMEKTNNLTKESRAVVKLEVLSNYVEFLNKNDNLRSKLRRYSIAHA